ncbi:hypothetical protein L798_04996 [Zootermopsis nevadensis]|uniref:Uncharacterized protein n=1 Tax=Zootermopsis nevadensis TaxID=136037 RepID=A0A067RA08_ZOONE|nr:hypothetical protein L798_04996 [Zootermopsis nevadensis]
MIIGSELERIWKGQVVLSSNVAAERNHETFQCGEPIYRRSLVAYRRLAVSICCRGTSAFERPQFESQPQYQKARNFRCFHQSLPGGCHDRALKHDHLVVNVTCLYFIIVLFEVV